LVFSLYKLYATLNRLFKHAPKLRELGKLFAVSVVDRCAGDDERLPIYRQVTKYRPARAQGFFDRIAAEFFKPLPASA
jgi:hypothetical protein